MSDALRKHFLFAQLTPADLSACVDVMGAITAAEGEPIVVQGERGSRFFVVEEGLVEVRLLWDGMGWGGTGWDGDRVGRSWVGLGGMGLDGVEQGGMG